MLRWVINTIAWVLIKDQSLNYDFTTNKNQSRGDTCNSALHLSII